MTKLIRSESHRLPTTPQLREDVLRTIQVYRQAVRALSTVIMTHWPEITSAPSKCFAIESLFHPTAKRPVVKYAILARKLGKMPSYLRRAAIEAAYGAVSSYLSNYNNWLDDKERARGTRPPRLGVSFVNPPLYGGNMILISSDWKTVQLKLLKADGQWAFTDKLAVKGQLKRLLGKNTKQELCPSLLCRSKQVLLSCPVEVKRPPFKLDKQVRRVCSVDVGINTAIVAAVVDHTGTVIARTFLTCGRHNDQRDKLSTQIAEKQSESHGGTGRRLGKGFCQDLHRRIAGLSLDAARKLVKQLMAFANQHQADAVIVEDLKGWKPKGKGAKQKKRFHRFQHRALIKGIAYQCEEIGMKFLSIFARGTSHFAYDGSGAVKRDKQNAACATFSNGRRYNADLNAAYNIAARGLIHLLKMKIEPKEDQAGQMTENHSTSERTGKSSGRSSRIPTVLADVWTYVQHISRVNQSAPTMFGCVVGSDAPTTALSV